MPGTSRARPSSWSWIAAGFIALLAAKFLWPLFVFDAPLGYDAGIYRYLFDRHALGFPPFSIAPMDPWALEHPLGLFFFSTILIRLGVPVDWLIGWMWNVFAVVLCAALAWSVVPRFGKRVAVYTLFSALLSVALFYGFMAMYWKTFASLFFMVLAYRGIDRKRAWAAIPAALAVVTHHQTGFLLLLSIGTLGIAALGKSRGRVTPRSWRIAFVILCAAAVAGLWYLPVWHGAIASNIGLLLRLGGTTPAGSFPDLAFFLLWTGPLLAMGLIGLVRSLKDKTRRFDIWHVTVYWLLFLIAIGFVFRNRFLLHLDFFLLPFAAEAILWMWHSKRALVQAAVTVLVGVQAVYTFSLVTPYHLPCPVSSARCFSAYYTIKPLVYGDELAQLDAARAMVPKDAAILDLDPVSAPFVRGWLTEQRVAGPGIFASPYSEKQWSTIILGPREERIALLKNQPRPLYVYLTGAFPQLYGGEIYSDPCVQSVVGEYLFRWNC